MRDKRRKGSTSQGVEQRDQGVSQDLKNLSCSLNNAFMFQDRCVSEVNIHAVRIMLRDRCALVYVSRWVCSISKHSCNQTNASGQVCHSLCLKTGVF